MPYDGSKEAKKGATRGLELAASVGATVHGLYVIDLPGAPRAMALRGDEEELRMEYREYAHEQLSELADLAADHGVDYERHTRSGSLSDEIVDFAEEEDVDAIVLGSAYQGKLGNLLGGTTDRVVRSTTVPSRRSDGSMARVIPTVLALFAAALIVAALLAMAVESLRIASASFLSASVVIHLRQTRYAGRTP
ncbi:MAG: universal stress protein [Halolamina sp.]